jgi:hypothetical protein
MTTTQRTHLQIAPVAMAVVGLAAANWYLNPDGSPAWAVSAVMIMAGIWLIVGLLARLEWGDATRKFLVRSAMMGGLTIALALASSLGRSLGLLTADGASRFTGVAAGLLLAAVGDAMPKAVSPIAVKPGEMQAISRFNGWLVVIAGLAFAAAWILLPLASARLASFLICGAMVLLSLLLVALRIVVAKSA